MNSVSPVWTDAEQEIERVIALDQKEYFPIIVLPVIYGDGTEGMSVRFSLTAEEVKLISEGADIVITELTFGKHFTPIDIKIVRPNQRPEGYE